MIGKKINQLATELAPVSTDLTIIGDPTTGVSKKITLAQLGAIFSGAVSFYTNLAAFPNPGTIDVIYCAKDTKKLYLWSGSAYVEVFPSQALLDTYQLRSEKGVSNGYASLDSGGKVPISQLPSSIMEYKGTWNAATNTPTLANGTGDTGDVYICNVAGTVNFGAGAITFAVGDYVIYSGSIWQRSSGAVGTVTSVGASITGDSITISNSPISTSGTLAFAFAGNSTQYVNGAGNLVTFPGIINEAQNLITEVYNKTGATLTKGTVVYINGGQGNLPTVTKALATGDSTSAQTYGIVRNDITNNNNGYVVVAGRISDLDTQAFTEGTQLYLSPTTAGTYTSTKPYAPNHLVYVGIVVRAHPTQGVIEVKIQNGYEMDELHNVAAQSPDNNDILQYKTATSLWTKVAGTTSNIAEGTNLYYTDARSRAAISLTTTGTSGAATYNNTTGVLNVPQYADQFVGTVTSVAALTIGTTGTDLSSTVANSTTTPVITLNVPTASATNRGALSSADWASFNSKQNAITLTTTGTSGAATLVGATLNIPNYAPDLSGYVPTSRTITINGTSFDLSANRSYSVGTVTSVGLSSATSGVTIGSTPITTSGTITLAIATASGSQQGLLSSTDWTTFNNKQNALTNPVTGTGTTNYLPKFTGTSTIGNSLIFDNGTNVGINTTTPVFSTGYTTLSLNGSTGGQIEFKTGDVGKSYIYSNSTDLRFFTSGGAFRFDGGNLGLGVTPSAWNSDYVAMQIGAKGLLYGRNGGEVAFGTNWYRSSGGSFLYATNGFASNQAQDNGIHYWYTAPSGTAGNAFTFTQAMTLDASGRLGVGTTNPLRTISLPSNSYIGFGAGNGTRPDFQIGHNSTEAVLSIRAGFGADDTDVCVTTGGNVGIGTTSPVGRLHILNASGSGQPVLELQQSNAGSNILQWRGSAGTYLGVISNDGNVGIGTTNPTSTLHVTGSVAKSHTTKSANYTLNGSDYTVGFDCASGDRTANLPDATTCAGRIYVIYQYNTGGSARGVTIDGSGSQLINAATTFLIKGFCDYSSVMIQSNGSNWIVIADAIQTWCL